MEYPAKFQSSGTYCLRCFYDLRGLPENRCPECGKTFDLQDSRTFSKAADRERLKNLIRRAKANLTDAVDSLLPPADPTASHLARLGRRVAALSVENEKLWDHATWLLGILMEKGIITEEDIRQQLALDKRGGLPASAEMVILDDTPPDEETPPTAELLELERFINEKHGDGDRSSAEPRQVDDPEI